jgi:hypothetical protein
MSPYNRRTLIVGLAIALLIGGGVSYFASKLPDGLDKTQENLGAVQPAHPAVAVPTAVFAEYNLKWLESGFWSNAVAGAAGCLLVLAILLGVGYILRRGKAAPPPSDQPTQAQG